MNNQYVNNVARQSGSNFYFSFFSLPKEKREAITAVYAFCREVDDAVDAPGQLNPAAEVEHWREEIARTYNGHPTVPLTRSLAQAIERFDLSRVYFDGILQGVAMDLQQKRYLTYESLAAYCYHVAGEVGLLCMEILGIAPSGSKLTPSNSEQPFNSRISCATSAPTPIAAVFICHWMI